MPTENAENAEKTEKTEKFEKQELTTRTLADVLAFIQKRNYDPGERLPSERELSERFGVGRGVVREALSVLENLRYLTRKPNSGVFLTPTPERTSLETLSLFSELGISLTTDKLREALEVRRIVEVQAVQLACMRRTDADLEALQSIVDRFDAAIAGSGEPTSDLDYEFHMAIFNAAHNTVLTQMVHPFYLMSAHRRATFFSDKTRSRTSNRQHRELLECLRRRDDASAQRIMGEHIGRVEAALQTGG
ncbi:DNA-binding FadR family transcriptional regulator [Cupriavidus gilardii J11]|uniref:DNA-binding FadR family transcriptional regulator n=1 Tax=Cupriavidus gilardii J11 TaxID=936133 RepID=A0A562B1P9_9BURK|nr:FadR/GntR family transcriptional regulator [Cupriavidus gilardii]TWG79033.1 DNA-binding FadR family transcriptional regulator [Cupriavidus gilardii J11]